MQITEQKQNKRLRRHRRVRAKVQGTAKRPRISVFKSNRALYLQLINDEAGRTLAAVSSRDVSSGKMQDRARGAGKLLAERAKGAGVEGAVFDRGGYRYTGTVKAAAEGAREGGLKF